MRLHGRGTTEMRAMQRRKKTARFIPNLGVLIRMRKQEIKEVKSAANASPSLPAHLPDLETETENKRKP